MCACAHRLSTSCLVSNSVPSSFFERRFCEASGSDFHELADELVQRALEEKVDPVEARAVEEALPDVKKYVAGGSDNSQTQTGRDATLCECVHARMQVCVRALTAPLRWVAG